jgi:endonuclease YncB( thermonuclease family)
MRKFSAICEYVQDGDTFRTKMQNWIRLARYHATQEGKTHYNKARLLLSSLILNKRIVYKQVGKSHNQIVAEVWQADRNINDIMIQSGY